MIEQKDIFFMKIALKEAEKAFKKNEVPVGALIVKNDKIISKAHTLKEKTNSPLRHAEILALQKAAKKLKTWKLNDCTIYSTLEPCELCASAIVSYRVERVVYALKKDNNNLTNKIFIDSSLNHKIKDITSGVLEDNSMKLIKDFFKGKR